MPGGYERCSRYCRDSLAIIVAVLPVRDSYQLGKLANKVDNQEHGIGNLAARVDELETKFDAWFCTPAAALKRLRLRVRRTNKILARLADQAHYADGRAAFSMTQG